MSESDQTDAGISVKIRARGPWIVGYLDTSEPGEPPDDAPELFRVSRQALEAADAKAELLSLADALTKGLVRASGMVPGDTVRYRGPGAPS